MDRKQFFIRYKERVFIAKKLTDLRICVKNLGAWTKEEARQEFNQWKEDNKNNLLGGDYALICNPELIMEVILSA